MKSHEYKERATLKLLSQADFTVETDIAVKLMGSPEPRYEKDPIAWFKWRYEAEGRFAAVCAEAFYAGVRGEFDRFEV